MYFVDNWYKFAMVAVIITAYAMATQWYLQENQAAKTEAAMLQLNGKTAVAAQQQQTREHYIENNGVMLGWGVVTVFCGLLFLGDVRNMFKKLATLTTAFLLCCTTGCGGGCSRKPFEPVKMEIIQSHEAAFLLPLTGDAKKQESSSNEEYLKQNLVYQAQVQIPQQWIPKGYETWEYNGEWRDAASLVKVDTSPVTREWTADPHTGTSNKNEAIWVMTSDQVEFSTGWTITARVKSRDEAVKFLHNYPNGSLTQVLDTEVRAKLQAVFGLEVTDLPMDELRKNATPHIVKTTKTVTEFFDSRGVAITNLGITGGFIYKDKSIIDTMVKVFNAEQEKSIAVANTNAQEEKNKAVILKAQGEADAILKTRTAEATGIKLVADAKIYEIEKAKADLVTYLSLKNIELQKELLSRWDGKLPASFIGGGDVKTPQMLLQLPKMEAGK
jgi:hypothetical protein